MPSDEDFCGVVHRVRVQRDRDSPNPTPIERKARTAVENAKQVAPFARIKPGVEFIIHDFRVQNTDRMFAEVEVNRIADFVSA